MTSSAAAPKAKLRVSCRMTNSLQFFNDLEPILRSGAFMGHRLNRELTTGSGFHKGSHSKAAHRRAAPGTLTALAAVTSKKPAGLGRAFGVDIGVQQLVVVAWRRLQPNLIEPSFPFGGLLRGSVRTARRVEVVFGFARMVANPIKRRFVSPSLNALFTQAAVYFGATFFHWRLSSASVIRQA
jgi:hypothetical protein